MNDPLGDMLTRIRNAQMRGKSTVVTPASKQLYSVNSSSQMSRTACS